MNKKLITFILLYLLFGIIYQVYLCSAHIKEISIPCAGYIWTPIVLLGWPLFGLFDLIGGFIIRGLIIITAFVLTILIPHKIFKKHL